MAARYTNSHMFSYYATTSFQCCPQLLPETHGPTSCRLFIGQWLEGSPKRLQKGTPLQILFVLQQNYIWLLLNYQLYYTVPYGDIPKTNLKFWNFPPFDTSPQHRNIYKKHILYYIRLLYSHIHIKIEILFNILFFSC